MSLYKHGLEASFVGAGLGVRTLAILVSVTLTVSPALAYGGEALAVARVAGQALRNGAGLATGSAILDGDRLATRAGSTVELVARGERVWLGSQTVARVGQTGSVLTLKLAHGQIAFSGTRPVEVGLEDYPVLLQSLAGTAADAQVSFFDRGQLEVRLSRGTLRVSQAGTTVVVEASGTGLLTMLPEGGTGAVSYGTGTALVQQAGTGTIEGTVVDTRRVTVADAVVTLTGPNGISRTVHTDATGQFAFRDLPPGTYTLQITKPGFSSYQGLRLELSAGQRAPVYAELSQKGHKAVVIAVIVAAGVGLGVGLGLALTGGQKKVSPSSVQ
jgi:hypothetical protein